MHIYEVLRRPLITEKSTTLQAQGKYAFEVAKEANKLQIKEAVEKAFSVKVSTVNTLIVRGKMKGMGRFRKQMAPWKKAVVTLKAGQKIAFFEGV